MIQLCVSRKRNAKPDSKMNSLRTWEQLALACRPSTPWSTPTALAGLARRPRRWQLLAGVSNRGRRTVHRLRLSGWATSTAQRRRSVSHSGRLVTRQRRQLLTFTTNFCDNHVSYTIHRRISINVTSSTFIVIIISSSSSNSRRHKSTDNAKAQMSLTLIYSANGSFYAKAPFKTSFCLIIQSLSLPDLNKLLYDVPPPCLLSADTIIQHSNNNRSSSQCDNGLLSKFLPL